GESYVRRSVPGRFEFAMRSRRSARCPIEACLCAAGRGPVSTKRTVTHDMHDKSGPHPTGPASTRGGTLYVVGTPIGNLEDLSPRARDVLDRVTAIAAEDTRRTSGLLSTIGLKKPLIAFHEHNEDRRAD